MKNRRFNLKRMIIFSSLLLFVIVIPFTSSQYIMTVINSSMIYFLVTLGISLLMGMGGQMSLAAISFMGLGCFFSAVLSIKCNIPPVLSIPLATAGSAFIAWIISFPLFRLSGAYFTFATIGLLQIFSCIFINFVPLSGGMNGTSGIPALNILGYEFHSLYSWFYLLCGCGLGTAFIVERIRKSSLGRSLASVRDDEVAAQTLGVNVYRTKIIAMTISSAFAGFAGALLAHHNGSASYSLFTFTTGTRFIIMVMLGGVNSTIGTFVGTMLITLLPEYMRFLQQYLNIIYGAIIVLLMAFMPMGLAGVIEHWWKKVENTVAKPKYTKK